MPLLRSFVERRSTALSQVNNPNVPLYQALSGLLDGVAVGPGGMTNLPAVNYESAVRITAVYRALNIIAGTIGALPFDVFERGADGVGRPIAARSPGAWVETSPNPEVTRSVFWETSIAHCAAAGNAYWYVVPDGLGQAVELWPIQPKRVQVGRDPETRRKVYVLDGDRDAPYVDYMPDGTGEIVHIPGFGMDGNKGMSIITQARLALQLSLAAEQYGARVFADGALPGGTLTTDQDLEPQEAKELAAEWHRAHGGLQRAHRVAVLDHGTKWEPTSINLEDAQFLEARKFQVSEIARMFGIAPHLLADVEGSTSWGTGIEEQGRNTVTYTFGSYIRRFEDAVTFRVLARYPGLYGRFKLDGLLRGDTKSRYEAYAQGRQWGWLSRNDIRRLEDMPPLDQGGDDYLTPMNMRATNETPLSEKTKGVGELIRAGFEPSAVLAAMGLPEIEHIGLPPVTVQAPKKAA